MLTNNYYQMLMCAMTGITITGGAKTTSGATADVYSHTSIGNIITRAVGYTSAVSTSKTVYGIAFGTGDAAPTRDDYWLSGTLLPNMKVVSRLQDFTFDEEGITIATTLTVQNAGSETVTIKEMAYLEHCYYSSSKSNIVLCDRTVLDAPLTLAPEEQGVITFTLTMPITA